MEIEYKTQHKKAQSAILITEKAPAARFSSGGAVGECTFSEFFKENRKAVHTAHIAIYMAIHAFFERYLFLNELFNVKSAAHT